MKVNNKKECRICGDEFKAYSTLDKYCSVKCKLSDKPKVKKPTNQALKTLEKMTLFLKNKSALKIAQIKQKGFNYCERCKAKNPYFLDAHHIVFRSERPNHPNLNDKINIILVCRECHNQFHEKKETRDEIVKERNLNQIFNL